MNARVKAAENGEAGLTRNLAGLNDTSGTSNAKPTEPAAIERLIDNFCSKQYYLNSNFIRPVSMALLQMANVRLSSGRNRARVSVCTGESLGISRSQFNSTTGVVEILDAGQR